MGGGGEDILKQACKRELIGALHSAGGLLLPWGVANRISKPAADWWGLQQSTGTQTLSEMISHRGVTRGLNSHSLVV